MIGDSIDSDTNSPRPLEIDHATGGVRVTLTSGQIALLGPGTNAHSSAYEKSKVVSAVACTLRSAKAINKSGSDAWLMIFDAAALPANGTLPSRTPVLVPAGSTNGDVWQGGTSLATGCVLALSSTVDDLTLIAGDDGFFDAEKS